MKPRNQLCAGCKNNCTKGPSIWQTRHDLWFEGALNISLLPRLHLFIQGFTVCKKLRDSMGVGSHRLGIPLHYSYTDIFIGEKQP